MSENLYIPWDDWQVVKRLGKGSYGSVYEIQRQIYGENESAAVKIISIPDDASEIDLLRASGYDDASIRTHFANSIEAIVREYGLMAKVKGNANVVYCDDFKAIPHKHGYGATIYIKMELLTPVLQALSPLAQEAGVIKFGLDISSALMACNARGILHRDIKPQNIFVAPDGTYKLGDFGIARTLEDNGSLTSGIGTHNYMAPEVYHKTHYDHRADIYSLGIVLYWLMNDCRLPFYPVPPQPITPDISDHARDRRLRGEELPVPRNGSYDLRYVIMKACSPDPDLRYRTAKELHDDLVSLRKGVLITAKEATERPADGTLLETYPEKATTGSHSIGTSSKKAGKYSKHKSNNNGRNFIAIDLAVICVVAVLITVFSFLKADSDGDDLSYPKDSETEALQTLPTESAYDLLLRQVLADGPDHVQRMRDGSYTESFLDSNDNVICICYRDLDGTILKKYTAEYNENDQLLYQLSYDNEDSLVCIERISYTETGDVLHREIKLGDGSIYREYEYQYRDNGELERSLVYDGNRTVLESTDYYFEGDKAARFVRTYMDGTYHEGVLDGNGCAPQIYYYEPDGTLIFHTDNTFDEEGREIYAVFYNPDDTVRFSNVTDYDARGNKTRHTCSDPDGEVLFWNEFTYDAIGHIQNMKNYANGGENYYFHEYVSDITDTLIREACYAKDGSYSIKYYDDVGNEQETFLYDEGGRMIGYEDYEYDRLHDLTGYTRTEYYTDGTSFTTWFNRDGQYTKVVYYNADKTISSKKEVTFDELGRPSREVTTQQDGFLSDLSEFTYEEDSDLVTLCMTVYNRNGAKEETHFACQTSRNIMRNIFDSFNNNMTKTVIYDADGNVLSETEYTYSDEKPGMTVRFKDYSEGNVTVSDVDENHQIVTQNMYDSNGSLIGILEYLYNDLGQNIRINHKRPNGYTYSYVEYKYNANGKVIDTKWYMPG